VTREELRPLHERICKRHLARFFFRRRLWTTHLRHVRNELRVGRPLVVTDHVKAKGPVTTIQKLVRLEEARGHMQTITVRRFWFTEAAIRTRVERVYPILKSN